jgi:neutral ceramidase
MSSLSDVIRGGTPLSAGAAAVDITPAGSVFLAGYPHVRRYSTGVHDPLLSSALYLESGGQRVMFIANDVIYVSKAMVTRARERIADRTGIPAGHILISATHTHSGPKMLDPLATSADDAVPAADPAIVRFVEDQIVDAALRAARDPVPAEIGLAVADATGIGTNRRDPAGPRDLQVPVMLVRDHERKPLAAMLVCSMHPTVLHEDSTLISGDFPGLARQILQRDLLGADCPVLYHSGPAGNQSPRHVTKANTFAEAERLGKIVADAAMRAIDSIDFRRNVDLECRRAGVTFPLKTFPNQHEAEEKLKCAIARLRDLRESSAPKTQIRTAEVDVFGAEETVTLARASGALQAAADSCMPAEIQAILIGPWTFIGWPGEMFVEFAIELKQGIKNSFPISYANGELQGYLVTRQAVDEGGYESANAIFQSPQSGEMLVNATIELLKDK